LIENYVQCQPCILTTYAIRDIQVRTPQSVETKREQDVEIDIDALRKFLNKLKEKEGLLLYREGQRTESGKWRGKENKNPEKAKSVYARHPAFDVFKSLN